MRTKSTYRYNDNVQGRTVKNGDFINRAKRTITKRTMLLPGERVGVAVSGGPDSVCLLHTLRKLAPRLKIKLGVIHLDHQLRGVESADDLKFVANLADEFELETDFKSFPVASAVQETGENLEQVARTIRYKFFATLIDSGRYDKIAVGHTRSDQAETVLFRFLRGAGSAGLAGVRPMLTSQIVRPLIELTRDDVMAYLDHHNYGYRLDSTNRDLSRARNRLRHDLLPQLQRDWNPNIITTLANTAEWARAEEEEWDTRLPALAQSHLTFTDLGLSYKVNLIESLSLAATRRLLRYAIKEVRGDLLGIDFAHVEALRQLAMAPKGTGVLHLPGLHAERSFGEIRIKPAGMNAAETKSYKVDINGPGSFLGPWGRSSLTLKLHHRKFTVPEQGYNGDWRELLDWEKLPRPLCVRNWQAGDRYHPAGRSGVKKLKSLFQERQVAAWRRRGWPVLVGAAQIDREGAARGDKPTNGDGVVEEIIWTRTFGPSVKFTAAKKSRILLEIREFSPGEVDFLNPTKDVGQLVR